MRAKDLLKKIENRPNTHIIHTDVYAEAVKVVSFCGIKYQLYRAQGTYVAANNTILEKGMTVEVSAHMPSDLFSNGSIPVRNAFINKYGVDLMKLGGPGAIWQYFDIKKIG